MEWGRHSERKLRNAHLCVKRATVKNFAKIAGWAASVCLLLPPKEGEKRKHERENEEQTTTNNRA